MLEWHVLFLLWQSIKISHYEYSALIDKFLASKWRQNVKELVRTWINLHTAMNRDSATPWVWVKIYKSLFFQVSSYILQSHQWCVLSTMFSWATYIRVIRRLLLSFWPNSAFFSPKGTFFLRYHMKKNSVKHRGVVLASLCLSYLLQLVIFVMLLWVGCLLWRGRTSPWAGPSTDFASKPKWGNVRQIFGKCKVKFNFSHFSFNESL